MAPDLSDASVLTVTGRDRATLLTDLTLRYGRIELLAEREIVDPAGVRLVDAGNTVIVIEHNLDVIKTADWIVDMGPEGGDGGGYVVAEGTPEQVATADGSHTGEFLRDILVAEAQEIAA